MKRILFVCLGNICRSVAAEGIMKKLVEEAGRREEFEIDSAGLIDYHEGELADPRIRAAAYNRGIKLTHRSRPVTEDDFRHFDLIIGMDADNIRRLNRIKPSDATARIVEAASYFSKKWYEACVPDPYYSGPCAFEHCLDQLQDVCTTLLSTEQ